MGEIAFSKIDWMQEDAVHRNAATKRLIYYFARPWLSRHYRRYLAPGTLSRLRPSLVLSSRGMPLEYRRKWAGRRTEIGRSTILVQGTGTGWDVLSWARRRPRAIIATDLFDFQESWAEIKRHVEGEYRVPIDFRQAPLEDHSFLPDASIDLCSSDAVFEHCRNLPSVVQEAFRVLKPGGTMYATYGPMWYSSSGDHFSGRGGPDTVFNHILLEPEDYHKYFESQLATQEDYQSGARYVELDLFSKLTTTQYLEIYKQAGFEVDELILELSTAAIAFKEQAPNRFAALVDKYAGICDPDDFLIGANYVRLLKPELP